MINMCMFGEETRNVTVVAPRLPDSVGLGVRPTTGTVTPAITSTAARAVRAIAGPIVPATVVTRATTVAIYEPDSTGDGASMRVYVSRLVVDATHVSRLQFLRVLHCVPLVLA